MRPIPRPITSVAALLLATTAAADFVHVRLEGMVDLGMAPLVMRSIETAKERGADGVLLEIDTFGGRVDAAVMIRDAILDADIPVHCWVNKRAISAGALIALSTDSIDMAPGSTVGAATPLLIEGIGQEPTPVDAKYLSYMREEFAATAEATKRRRDVAEAMVDASVVVKDFEGPKPLTLTTEDALKLALAARSSETLTAAASGSGFEGSPFPVEINWAERLARLITNPICAGLLLTVGLAGIVLEVKTPGWGPGVVGGLALTLFFAGHHVVRLAGWEEVALVVLGIVLLAVEIFIVPGFGLPGIAGLGCLLGGLLLAMTGHDFDLAVAAGTLRTAAVTLSSATLLSAAALVAVIRWLPGSRMARRGLYLDNKIQAPTGSFPTDVAAHAGRTGIAHTMLRPSGAVLVDGERLDAVSEGDVIPAGSPIVVVGARGASVVVRLARSEPES